jgi:hypothetical protein
LRCLDEIGDQIGAVTGIGHAGIGHAIAGHQSLRIGDEFVERLRRPDDAAALDGRRIPEIRDLAGSALKDAMQARPDIVGAGLELVAGGAILKTGFATRGIAVGAGSAVLW